MHRMILALLALAGVIPIAQTAPDVIIVNARVFTGVPATPWAEALSVKGDRIAAVGSTAAIRAGAGATTKVIDAGGKLVIPGINDAHAHVGASPARTVLEGPSAFDHDPTLDEVIERIKAAVPKGTAGTWITGEIGATVLDDPKATRATFDPITGGRPLMLTAWTGHGTIVNTAALRRLHVRDDELDPPGGYFGRMPDGKTLTGVAHEYAEYPLGQRFCMEPPAPSQLASFKGYATEAATFGITTVQVMTTRYPSVKLASILEHGDVPVRLRLIDFPMIAMSAWPAPASRSATVASNRLRVSGTKWILDGTPIERAMLLREPYADAPQTRGRANFSATDLRQFLTRALEAREQPMLHAVGDGAIGQALDALEATGGERWQPLRPRLEHADLFAAADFGRAKRLGVVIVQNPSHFMIPTLSTRLGAERMAHVQQVRAIVEAGIPFAIGSDGPMNPFLNMMFAAINPANHSQALSIEQSLTAYTRGSAYAESTESEKGTIAPGMIADLAMLSQDIFRVPLDALPATTSVLTLVGGTVVHSR